MATIRKLNLCTFYIPPSSATNSRSSTRWQAQIDAVSVVHTAKMRVHPQSAVGLMSMGGTGPEVLSTFPTDFGGILAGLHRTKIHGTAHFCSSIQVAGVCFPHSSPFRPGRIQANKGYESNSWPSNTALRNRSANASSYSPAPPSKKTKRPS